MLGEHMLLSDEERRQQAVDSLHILDTPPDERIDRVTRLAQELFQVPMVSVTLIDRERQWRKSEIGLGGPEAPRKDSFCDATLRRGGSLVIEDASQDSEFSTNPFVAGDPHLRFYAGNALHAPCGEQVGTLCIMDTAPRVLDQRQRGLLQDLSLWVQTEMARQSELDDLAVIQRTLRPRRLSAGELAELLFGEMGHEVALRAEIVRLRRFLRSTPASAGLDLQSRPYRLSAPLDLDALTTMTALTAGDRSAALDMYAGPLLPASEAPGIRSLRQHVSAVLREALLADGSADELCRYLQLREAAEDHYVIYTALQVLPADSPQRAALVASVQP